MSENEDQSDEREVLLSIFEDDEAFKQISDTTYQYKIGADGDAKSFLLEFVWPPDYPNCAPDINLNAFYNNHILPDVKCSVLKTLNIESESLLGEAMLYSLIDYAKENHDDLLIDQPLQIAKVIETPKEQPVAQKKEKKEHLTKAQKRKLADRVNAIGEKPRGWNWIDPIKHLSQTGRQADDES